MNELTKTNLIVTNQENGDITISARELHRKLEVNTRFNDWFSRMCEYGFEDKKDFYSFLSKTSNKGGRPSTDYQISIDMAKEICMIQRTEKGRQYRHYFLKLEKAWNNPQAILARALQVSQNQVAALESDVKSLSMDIERMKPKEIFTDAVSASNSSILIRDLAKLLRQNGINTGEKRLYNWMREHGYICKGTTAPTQKAMELGLFEVVVNIIQRGGDCLPRETRTTKVTGKGQIYFVNKFLSSMA